MALTDRQLRALKPGASRYTRWEGGGLGVRVSPKGRKTWVFKYRHAGRQQYMSLGVYPKMGVAAAHKALGAALDLLASGVNPRTVQDERKEEARRRPSARALADEYIDKWSRPRKRSWAEDRRILDKDVLPVWGDRKACEITRRDVIQLLDRIHDRAPIMGNRTLAVVRKMFNFAVSRDILPVSPCLGVQAPAKECRRDRVLDRDEIRALWNGLTIAPTDEGRRAGRGVRMAYTTRYVLLMQMLTAQRKGEIAGSVWAEFDLDTGWWTIPGERSKNALPHRVPMSATALQLLDDLQALSGESRYLFPSPRGDKPVTATAIDHAVKNNLHRLGLEDFKPHDIRRTVASHLTAHGVSRLVVAKILNHADNAITAVYDRHSYDPEKRAALDAWARILEGIVNGRDADSNVVELTPAG